MSYLNFIIEKDILKKYNGMETDVIVPEGIREIAESAFSGCQMERISLPASLKKIGKYAFFGTHNLKSVTIPDGVTTIGKGAFCGSWIETVVLPKKLKSIGEETFSLSKLREIIFPNGLKTIGNSAFSSCFHLEKVIFPDSIEKIGDFAFLESGMKTTNLSEVHPQIGKNAFGLCDGLADKEGFIVINGILFESPAMYQKEMLSIPETVTEIPLYSLSCKRDVRYRDENKAIISSFCKKIVIPKTVRTLAEIKCPNVKEIEIHAQITLGPLSLCDCKKLKKLSLIKGSEISPQAFGFDEKSVSLLQTLKIQYYES